VKAEHDHDVKVVRALLAEAQQWHLAVFTYGITHSSMQLALMRDGDFPHHYRLLCTLCERIHGELHGGPYVLELRDVLDAREPLLELRAADGSFSLVCRWIKYVGRHHELFASERIQID